MGRRKLTPDQIRRGPLQGTGPDLSQPLTVVAGKTQGVTPGFTIQDSRGDRYVIKFDPLEHPELATGADAIAVRLVWAIGYNTSEDYLVRIRPEMLSISPKATVRLELGKRRPLVQADLDVILSRAPREPDGSIRVIASKFLAGKPLGPIPFIDVRRSDPNDVIRHEHRRELRGYEIFCSWINHNDSREINTLDMYVEEDGRRFVKHHILDLNATLGSASVFPNLRNEGFEYQFDLGEMGKSLATFGLYQRPWIRVEWPQIRGVGRFEAAHFDPGSWKANYPFPTFENTTDRDGFWAAKIVMRFDDTLLRAAVETAEYSDPAATDYMVRTLAERRDRIGRYWFARVNPLDEFEIGRAPSKPGGPAGPVELRFADLAVRHGFAPERLYDVRLRVAGKEFRRLTLDAPVVPLGDALNALGTPGSEAVASRLLEVEIRSRRAQGTTPATRVTLYLHPQNGLRLAAIDRDS
jgi:hypothetical protein